MKVIYQTTITKVGAFARDALEENMLITFKQDVPKDLEDYCFVHHHDVLAEDVQVGDVLMIDEQSFPITAVGGVASFNLKELGHATWRFDGASMAEYPGTVHVNGQLPTQIDINSTLSILRK